MHLIKKNHLAEAIDKSILKFKATSINLDISGNRGHFDIQSPLALSKSDLTLLDEQINQTLVDMCIKSLSISGLHYPGTDTSHQRIHFIIGDNAEEVTSIHCDLEEHDQYDHRTINQKLRVFHIDPMISPGSVIWLPNGMTIVNELRDYIRRQMNIHNYQEVSTPAFANYKLWQLSGHWEMYSENMLGYNESVNNIGTNNEESYLLKPMSCPLHGEIMKLMKLSYKNLPLKLFEFGNVYRNEPSGALHGLFRARQFTQDDAHIFCKEEHIQHEILYFCNMLQDMYHKCGFQNIHVKLSTRPKKFTGLEKTWNLAEAMLKSAMQESGLSFELLDGEGAFYGPKLEFHILDQHGRSWQCGTLQLDLMLAERLNLRYVDHDNKLQYPVIIHHAIFGSIERAVGMLMEYSKGWLPLWLAPIQISIVTITDRVNEFAGNVKSLLQKANIRVHLDGTNNTLGYKIKAATNRLIPIIAVIGDKELEQNSVSIRYNNSSEMITYDRIIEYMSNKVVKESIKT